VQRRYVDDEPGASLVAAMSQLLGRPLTCQETADHPMSSHMPRSLTYREYAAETRADDRIEQHANGSRPGSAA
jgi:hypothetical protein